ncbi:MAG: hypothetical protein ACLVEJ_13265 [Parabacteroides sp.]
MKYICCLILFFTVLLPSCQWGRQEAFFPDEGLAERLLRENPGQPGDDTGRAGHSVRTLG